MSASADEIRNLIRSRQTAALGTLHDGAPLVSLVPFVWQASRSAFLIHVSRLSAHTTDMQREPRVSLMITAAESPEIPPQALPRFVVQGRAALVGKDTDSYQTAKTTYLARFPNAAITFKLGDFFIFTITPEQARWVGGFGRAENIDSQALNTALAVQ